MKKAFLILTVSLLSFVAQARSLDSEALECRVKNQADAEAAKVAIQDCLDSIEYISSLPNSPNGTLTKKMLADAKVLETKNQNIARYCGRTYAHAVCPIDYKF